MQKIIISILALVVLFVIVGVLMWQRNSPAPISGIGLDEVILDLSSRGLTTLPAEIGEYTRVRQLILDDNNLTGSLPAEIRKLTELEILSARNNQLTGIPAEIGQLHNLTLIDFSGNDINTYPNELTQLQQTLTLDLRGNPFTTDQIAQLRKDMPQAAVLF